MKTTAQPEDTGQLPHAIQEQIDQLLDGVAAQINRITEEMKRVPPSDVPTVIARHHPDFAQPMEALGNWMADYLAQNPPPDEIERVRACITGPLRTWSKTSALFYRILNTPSNKFEGFEILELLLENRSGGADPSSQILDHYYLNMITVRAYRHRFWQIVHELSQQTTQRAAAAEPVHILGLHTGSALEILQLTKERTFVRSVEVTCVDPDSTALRRARDRLKTRLLRPLEIILADPSKHVPALARSNSRYDLIYASTLFDQLKDPRTTKLFADCYQWLKPGGALIFGNLTVSMPRSERMIIGWGMNWDIRYRSEEGLKKLFDRTPFGAANVRFQYEPLQASMLVVAERR